LIYDNDRHKYNWTLISLNIIFQLHIGCIYNANNHCYCGSFNQIKEKTDIFTFLLYRRSGNNKYCISVRIDAFIENI